MAEINDVTFCAYSTLGYIVDPPSDTKVVFIPSPPTKMVNKVNPRAVVIYVAGGKIVEGYEKLDALKAYCKDNKVVFVCPTATDSEALVETYQHLTSHGKTLNIKLAALSIAADADHLDLANELVAKLLDDTDADVDDAQVFSL